jgi:hypothetical protein
MIESRTRRRLGLVWGRLMLAFEITPSRMEGVSFCIGDIRAERLTGHEDGRYSYSLHVD